MSTGARPPDANGAVGPNHFVQVVNGGGSSFEIWDKKGNYLAGPTSFGTLWSGAPGDDDCKNRGRGDPYVLYYHLYDRWVLSQLANHTTNTGDPLQTWCIAVSKGPNPVTDGFFAYTFFLGVKNDYVKLAVWPDGYYGVSQRGYDGTSSLDVWVFDRANMVNGNPATFQHPTFPGSEHDVITLPGELTGPPPPAGTPNYYARPYDGNLYSDGSPRLEIFEFHTDWGVPANTTFTKVQTLTPATFRSDLCAGSALNQDCVPQPNETNKLDGLSIWPMGPLQYRNFGDHETLVFNHTVNVDGSGLAGIRWYELTRTPPGSGSWVIQQEGTFSPTDSPTSSIDSIYRWGGSVAMDQAGNMAMGYSASNDGVSPNPTVYPSIRYVGRLATDPAGEMTTPEVTLVDGSASQPQDNPSDAFDGRWGDYSSIRVDPTDGCTFWYTTEYVASTSTRNTRFGAFRFPTCNPANLAITKSGSPNPVIAGNQINYTLTVSNSGPADATNVVVTDTLPAGVTFLSSSIPCTGAGSIKTCNIGNLANGAGTSFTIQVMVPANFLSSAGVSTKNITNSASVSATEFDPDTSDNTANVTTNVVEQADVRITKTCKPDTAAPAGSAGYCNITVSNLGVSDAQNVTVTDVLTDNSPFQVTSYGVTPPVTCGPAVPSAFVSTFTVNCNVGTLSAGASTTIRVNVTANVAGDINDSATVASSTPDPNTSNNLATGRVTFGSTADLSVVKTSSPNPVVAGTNLTYMITASNAGPSPALNVVVKDTLPGQVSIVAVTPSTGQCSGGIPGNPAQPLLCALGTINSGGSATISVVVNVSPSTPQGTILINNAAISSDTPDANNNNNVFTANTSVNASADLAIVKTSDQPNYKPNAVITYTLSVVNNGPSDALAVIVKDNLPNVSQAIYLSDTGGCTKSGNSLTCNMGNMPVGTNKNFNVYMRVKGNRGTVTNSASVTSSTSDPAIGNNSASLTVGVK